jgi:hypothetical protein
MRTHLRRPGHTFGVWRVASALGLVALLATGSGLLTTPTASAANFVNIHLMVAGVANLDVSTCPYAGPPTVDTDCTDTYVALFQEGLSADHPRPGPWAAFVHQVHYIAHPDTTATNLAERAGFSTNVVASFDVARLTNAQYAMSMPMDDGSVFPFDVTIDASAMPLNTAGNLGPFESSGTGHFVDSCLTSNVFNHERWRQGGTVTGSIDGVPVASLYVAPWSPSLVDAVWSIVLTTHGPACTS